MSHFEQFLLLCVHPPRSQSFSFKKKGGAEKKIAVHYKEIRGKQKITAACLLQEENSSKLLVSRQEI